MATKYDITYAKANYKSLGILPFYGHYQKTIGKIDKACFSNWFPCEFNQGKSKFVSTEQYMMVRKAILFKDMETALEMMKTTDPKTVKDLGRKVKNFDEKSWNDHKFQIMVDGLGLKFGQNPKLKAFLLSTGNRILCEASPYDRIWGIGMKATDPKTTNPSQWKGENLLGYALMETRDLLRT